MNVEKLKCVIELGSKKIHCTIAQGNDEDLNYNILSSSTVESKGIHNGTVVNPSDATKSIRSCLNKAEVNANVVLKKINVVLETPEFTSVRFSKYRKINGSKIQEDDIAFLLKEAKKELTLNDSRKTIIHIFNYNYIVDGKKFHKEPIDIYADYFSHEITFVTIPKNIIKNLNQVFFDCDLEIERFISSTFALAINHLNETDLYSGSALVDIGFEKTSLGIFKNSALIHSLTFPIGINHIAKDISIGCSLSLNESIEIRNAFGCSLLNLTKQIDNKKDLSKEFFKETKFRKITKSLISEIIFARVEEIMKIVKKEIYLEKSASSARHNIFITGGGSNLLGIDKFCSDFFSTNIKLLKNTQSDPKTAAKITEAAGSCEGALKIIFKGWDTEAIATSVDKKRGFFSKIMGKLI